jgi:transcriptional regulator with XRE-family HTH domain
MLDVCDVVPYLYVTMNLVKQVREAKRLRREDLAVRAGISVSYVFKLEREPELMPGLEHARAIARALGTTVDKLFPPVAQPATAGKR